MCVTLLTFVEERLLAKNDVMYVVTLQKGVALNVCMVSFLLANSDIVTVYVECEWEKNVNNLLRILKFHICIGELSSLLFKFI